MAMTDDEVGGLGEPSGLRMQDFPVGEALGRAGEEKSEGSTVCVVVTKVYGEGKERCNVSINQTIGDLKKLVELRFEDKPHPSTQKLIYHGKICRDEDTVENVLRAADKSHPQTMHLLVPRKNQDGSGERVKSCQPAKPPQTVRAEVDRNDAMRRARVLADLEMVGEVSSRASPSVNQLSPSTSTVSSHGARAEPALRTPEEARGVAGLAEAGSLEPVCPTVSVAQMQQLEWQYFQVVSLHLRWYSMHMWRSLALQHTVTQHGDPGRRWPGFVHEASRVNNAREWRHGANVVADGGVRAMLAHAQWHDGRLCAHEVGGPVQGGTLGRRAEAGQMPMPAAGGAFQDVTPGVQGGVERLIPRAGLEG
ncbi:unnamed protein product, partial [Discosporangium mesarthrocarpum]